MTAVASCPRCGSTRLFEFTATSASVRNKVADLPVVCRQCNQIIIGGRAVVFPPAIEEQAKNLADASMDASKATVAALKDPTSQAEFVLAKYFREVYLDGFWRALAYFRHNAKEGRLRRLRELWKQVLVTESGLLQMPPEAYAEFEALLQLGAGAEDKHAGGSD